MYRLCNDRLVLRKTTKLAAIQSRVRLVRLNQQKDRPDDEVMWDGAIMLGRTLSEKQLLRAPAPRLPPAPPRPPYRPCVCSHGFNEHFSPAHQLGGCAISGCKCMVYVNAATREAAR